MLLALRIKEVISIIMKIQESGENYLETILILQNRSGFVRSIDVATELNYSKASVSRAMSILKKANLITIAENGQILLTQEGIDKANSIYERHRLITEFLVSSLGINDEIAATDACRIEHIISQETFDKIKDYVKNSK